MFSREIKGNYSSLFLRCVHKISEFYYLHEIQSQYKDANSTGDADGATCRKHALLASVAS